MRVNGYEYKYGKRDMCNVEEWNNCLRKSTNMENCAYLT